MINNDEMSLYKLDQNGILTRREEKLDATTIVLPQALVPQMIKTFHESYGHPDAKRTLIILRRRFYAPSLQRQVNEHMSSCHVCQIMNRRTAKLIGFLKPREIPENPNTIISIDHFGPLPPIRQYKHVLLIVDHATRFIEAIPMRSTSSKETIKNLHKHWIARFGIPSSIMSDNATGYTSREMQVFLSKNNIDHILSPLYNPESNGLVERLVQTLKTTLRKVMINKDWVSVLPMVVMQYNATYGHSLQESPFYLMHGYHPQICSEDSLITIEKSEVSRIKSILELLHQRRKSRQHLATATDAACRKNNDHRRQSTIKIGDEVLTEITEPSVFGPRWEGPYVIDKIENDIVSLIDEDGKPIRKAKLRQLRPFKDVTVCEDANISSKGRVTTALS